MSVKDANFPASVAFDLMNEVLSSSDSERKDAIKQGNAIYAFQLNNTDGKVETWYLDLKEQGKVSKGSGGKPDVTLVLSDKDFSDLVAGKANAQRLFMSGKLKIRGNIMKATKMEPILKKAQTKAKL